MATSPSSNPVPSEAYADLRYNSGVLDSFLNSQEDTFTDRLGNEKETLKSITVNAASAQQIEAAKNAATSAASSAAASEAAANVSAGNASTSAAEALSRQQAAATSATQAAASAAAAANPNGVADGSDAAAGKVGEYLSATATSVSMVSGTAKNIVSLSLTAGDWDVNGTFEATGSSAVITNTLGGFTTVSGTAPSFPNRWRSPSSAIDISAVAVPFQRVSISSTTTLYLVASVTFGSGTVTTSGVIRARRAR